MRIHGMTRPVAILLAGVWLVSGCTNPNDPVGANGGSGTPAGGSGSPTLRVSTRQGDIEVGGKVFFELLTPGNTVSTETITIHNDGEGTLVFSEISLLSYGQPHPHPGEPDQQDVTLDDDPDDGVFYWISLPSTAPLAAGTSRDVTVQIEYKSGSTYRDALITIDSNDGVNPSRRVLLEVTMAEDGPP